MAQNLAEIIKELDALYTPQTSVINEQLTALPAYYQAQAAGLDQAKTNAFGDITSAANARGVLYSGVPINEQAQYVGEKYLPALAGLKQQEGEGRSSLMSALAKIRENQGLKAYDIRESQLGREAEAAAAAAKLAEERRQFDREYELARYKASTSGGSGSSATPAPRYKGLAVSKADGGFDYYADDAQEKPISAAQYAYLNNIPLPYVLASSTNASDQRLIKDIANGLSLSDLKKKYPNAF